MRSWGSGANPWGPEKEDQFSKPNHWDGMLEVVGVTGVVHLGQIQSGLRSAMRIAQVCNRFFFVFFLFCCRHLNMMIKDYSLLLHTLALKQ